LVTKFVKRVPPSVDTSIRYPVMAAPPLLVGAVQDKVILVGPSAAAVRDVGGPGAAVTSACPEKPVFRDFKILAD